MVSDINVEQLLYLYSCTHKIKYSASNGVPIHISQHEFGDFNFKWSIRDADSKSKILQSKTWAHERVSKTAKKHIQNRAVYYIPLCPAAFGLSFYHFKLFVL